MYIDFRSTTDNNLCTVFTLCLWYHVNASILGLMCELVSQSPRLSAEFFYILIVWYSKARFVAIN